MIKVLIICKNNSTAKLIVNHVISNLSELRLIGIANSLDEGIKFLEKHEPSLIITTNETFVNYINVNGKSYTPGIILISKPDEIKPVAYRFKNLLLHLNYTENFKVISEQAFQFIEKNYTTSKRKRAKEILADIGFDFKLSGTIFLLDSILYISTYTGAYYFEHLSRDIYPYIAKIHNTNPNIIKWAVTRSINYMYEKQTRESYKNIEKYLNIEFPEKPTPKLVIRSVIHLLEK